MARLRRLYYDNIGHPEARFMDLTIPLANGTESPTDSVIWLKNGGGKSALLSLVFAVVRPALREFLGQKVDDKIRTLSDYVLRDDHGVVVLEWEMDDLTRVGAEPTRLLTGVFLERRTGASRERLDTESENEGPVERLYFSYYVRPDVLDTRLEALPLFTDSSHRARFAASGFKARLNEIAGNAPHAQVFHTDKHTEWLDLLASRGIDADLFTYQIRMNQREGGAKDLFKECTTIESYIDLFLEVLIHRGFGDNIRQNLAAQREALAHRKFHLIPGRALTEALLAELEPLRTTAVARAGLTARGAELVARLQGLTSYAQKRLTYYAQAITSFGELARDAQENADNRRAAAAHARRRAAEMRRDAALVSLREAKLEQKRITDQYTELQRLSTGWQAVIPLRDAMRHERSAQGYREEIAQRERQHAPFLERVREAAAALLGALRAHDEALAHTITAAQAQINTHEEEEKSATLAAKTSTADSARFEADAQAADGRDRLLQDDLHQLVRKHVLLRDDETPTNARLRLAEETRDADASVLEEERVLAAAVAAREHAEARVKATERSRHEAERSLETERQALHVAESRGHKISALPRLAATFELTVIDVTVWREDSVVELRRQAQGAYERALLAHAIVASTRRSSDSLRETGLLPCSIGVARVLKALEKTVPQAHAGWRYLADAMTATEAAQLVERAPDIALGVVVRDDDYDAAARVLRLTPPELDEPVRVVRQSDVATAPLGAGFVVPPSTDAHFDRAAGQRALATLDQQLAEAEAFAKRADEDHRELATTATTLDDFLHDYGATWFAQQRAEVARLTETLEASTRVVADARMTFSAAKLHESACQTTHAAAIQRRRDIAQCDVALTDFIRRHGDDTQRYRRDGEVARRSAAEARTQAQGHESRAAASRQAASAARDAHLAVAQERAVLDQDMRQVLWAPESTPAVPGDRRALQQEYVRAKDAYDEKINSQGLLALAERDDAEAKVKREEVRKRLAQQRHAWTEPSLKDLLATLIDPSEADAELARIDAEKTALFSQHGNHSKVVQAADSALKSARDLCTDAGCQLSAGEEEARLAHLPVDGEHSARIEWQKLIVEAEREETIANSDAAAAEATRADAEKQLEQAGHAERSITASMTLLRTAQEQQPTFLTQFAANADAILARTPETDDTFTSAVEPWTLQRSALLQEWMTLDTSRDRAARSIHRLLGMPAYGQLLDPFMSRIRDAEPTLLEAHVEELATDLSERLSQIVAAIADVDRHRDVLIQLTLAAGEEGRRLLRQLAARSMVPTTVPQFGGHAVLQAHGLEAADPAVERAAAEALIESLTTTDNKPLPSPLELVQQAVHAIAPRVSIRVLFPKTERGLQYWHITQLGKMSGGEGLTIATLLYCTLARVRAIAQGKTGGDSSVLLFDNPFGLASAATFITLQREVARALNVQLIYFTGVLDLEAVRLLPNRVRLGNSRYDRASGHLLVEREDDEIVEALRDAEATDIAKLTPVQLVVDDRHLYGAIVPTDVATTATQPVSVAAGDGAPSTVRDVNGARGRRRPNGKGK